METGRKTGKVLATLEAMIADRAREGNEENSYTASLLARGPQKCAKKLGEEGVEAALACIAGSRQEFVGEAADLLYHLLVALAARDVSLQEVEAALEERRGLGGFEEKAQRKTT